MDELLIEQKKMQDDGKCADESAEQYGSSPRRSYFCELPRNHKGKHVAHRNEHGLKVKEEWD